MALVLNEFAERVHATSHETVDMGSIGYLAFAWLIREALRQRGNLVWDRAHRICKHVKEAQAESGTLLPKAEWSSTLNARKGPFKRSAHHLVMRSGVQQLKAFIKPGDNVVWHTLSHGEHTVVRLDQGSKSMYV